MAPEASGSTSETRFRATGAYKEKMEKQKAEREKTYTTFDDVLTNVNPFGVYQIFACFCIVFAQILWAGNFSFVNIVGSTEPSWLCTYPDGTTAIIKPDADNKCDILQHKCSSFTALKNSTDFNSIVASFKMVCDDRNKPEWIQISLACAMLVGSVIGGHLGDWYGRQFLFYVCQLGVVITSCLTTAAQTWQSYIVVQALNGILYGIIEVESITLLMEYTNNVFRMIPNACYQANIANIVIALIAYLTKDWQLFFVFLNLVTSPIIMMFMLFNESPRWLVATGRMSGACNVLNDIANRRWNGTEANFTSKQLEGIPHETHRKKYNFFHLFSNARVLKQSCMQLLSMFTYSLVSICYLYVIKDWSDVRNISPILLVCLDGVVRLIIPILIIILDYKFKNFTRRSQFLGSLTIMALCFIAVIALVATGSSYTSPGVVAPLIVAAMINDSAFWMNIIQVTTQRYPTVIRCIAFGCLHSAKHIGTVISILIMHDDLLKNEDKRIIAFIVPGAMVIVTLVVGYFLQHDTKGKRLLDTIDQKNFDAEEFALPRALMQTAIMYRVMNIEMQKEIVAKHSEEWQKHMERLNQDQNEGGAVGNGDVNRLHPTNNLQERRPAKVSFSESPDN
uniref:MFS domain-containing protein n=1 Tax=Panagrellus redivivus TaxID=6233 RepID=A0A7E4UV30_PANRE